MRFVKYIAIGTALLAANIQIVHSSISPEISTVPAASVDEYIHDSLTAASSMDNLLSGAPGAALFIRRHLRRPGAAESLGLVNIINIPHFVFGESTPTNEIRSHLTRTFSLIRDTLNRHPELTTVVLNGEGSFDSMIAAAPESKREEIRRVLDEVIHATFDELAGTTVQLNYISYVTVGEESTATYLSTRMIMGPQTFSRLGHDGRLATTLFVNVFNPVAIEQRHGFTWILSQLIPGGLVLPTGIPDVLATEPQSAPSVVAVAESPLAVSTLSSESSDHRPSGALTEVEHRPSVGLTEEEEAQIAAAIAEFDDAQAGMVEDDDSEVRPAEPARVMRLIGDEDDLPPFDPSTESDPDIRAALIASREQFLAGRSPPVAPVIPELEDDTAYRRAIDASLAAVHAAGGGYDNEEDQMLAAAIEQSMQRPRATTPEAAVDVDEVVARWMSTGPTDPSELVNLLIEAGLDEETSLAIAEQYLE